MAIQWETQLSPPIKQLFESMGYEVKSEVLDCDLVAYRADLPDPVIIELKKSLTVPLLIQGMQRQLFSPNIYIAVEKKKVRKQKEWKPYIELCKRLGLGLITVEFYKKIKPRVEICCDPSDSKRPGVSRRRTAKLMKEFHARSGDYNVGGSSRRKIVTAYREHALYFAYLTEKHGTVSPKQLREWTGLDKAGQVLQRNVYGWFNRIERGKYVLTDAGKKALSTYGDVVAERFVEEKNE